MKKRKPIFWIITVLVVAVIATPVTLGTLWFKQYYDNRYVTDDYYYTIIPLDYDITPTRMRNSQGEQMESEYEKQYTLTCYNAEGTEKELTFRALLYYQELYPPGTYVRVSVSKTSVIEQFALDESDVPKIALEKIKENFTPSSASTLAEYADERTGQLSARNTPSLTISCVADNDTLIYTYLYSAEARELAKSDAELHDPVYRAQFRTDKETFPELTAIFLEIKLDDGTVIFSQKYDTRVEFSYEKE